MKKRPLKRDLRIEPALDFDFLRLPSAALDDVPELADPDSEFREEEASVICESAGMDCPLALREGA